MRGTLDKPVKLNTIHAFRFLNSKVGQNNQNEIEGN